MRLAFLMAIALASLEGLANAQVVEREKSKSTTQEKSAESAKSKAQQIVRSSDLTYGVGSLFFKQLAALEAPEEPEPGSSAAHAAYKEDNEALFLDPKEDGAWLKALRCRILSTRQMVYGGTGSSANIDLKYLNPLPEETPVAYLASDSRYVSYVPYLARAYGTPLRPADYITCVNAYGLVVADAVQRLAKKGRLDGDAIVVPEIQEAAKSAFVDALREAVPGVVPVNAFIELRRPKTPVKCLVPTSAGLQAGSNTFQCGEWTIKQKPLDAREAGRVVLSESEAMGIKAVFADGKLITAEVKSSKSDKSSSANQGKESKKAKVAK